jgi:hypothetical protein
MVKYLYNSSEIRTQIEKIFLSPAKEKWAIVGFVGYGGLDQLPKGVTGLQVICWPKAGATHPDGVRRLLEADISVYFCENLHHKLYWAKDVGLIAGSANLSARALSGTAQHEFCVYCEDPKFDINSVLRGLKYKPVDEKSLHALDIAHVAAGVTSSGSDEDPTPTCSFEEASAQRFAKKWKLVIWCEYRKDNVHVKKEIEQAFGQSTWANDNDVDEGIFSQGDFVLQVHIDHVSELIKRANCKWLRVEHVMKQGRQSVIVQVKKMVDGAPPPFEIDNAFRSKFKELFNNSSDWGAIYDANHVVRKGFISKLRSMILSDA